MKRILSFALIITAFGCRPDFATVGEACDGKVPGSNNIDDQTAIDVFARINCYRRLSKMTRANIDKQIQEAVANHNKYQLVNATEADLNPWSGIFEQESGKPHFTGVDVYDRLRDAGYANLDRGTLSYWQWSYQDDQSAVDRIDFWFPEPAVRQSYLQPAWVGGGYKEGPTEVDPERRIAYVNLFYQVPVLEHQANPVIFPKDGQEDVPTSFEALWDATATFGMGQLGYPITVTVGSQGDPNIQVRSSTLSGPDGNVELFVETPGDGMLTYSAAFYPMEPLLPNSSYTFSVEMDWADQEKRSLEATWKTGPEFEPHGYGGLGGGTSRRVPEPPVLRRGWIELGSD